jgi:hypothetical protein
MDCISRRTGKSAGSYRSGHHCVDRDAMFPPQLSISLVSQPSSDLCSIFSPAYCIRGQRKSRQAHTSREAAYDSTSIDALAAAYTAIAGIAILDAMEPMLTMRPPRGITGTTAWIIKSGPYTLTPKTAFRVSCDTCSKGAGFPAAALLTAPFRVSL